MTQKISWSEFTQFPFHSFYWEGIDGTQVLSHFLPARSYGSRLDAMNMMGAERAYREKDRSAIQAIAYGFSDGGGGPVRDHLERLKRYSDLEGMPKVRPITPKEFFKRLESESADLPKWVGELYLEYHRGTYTTQADTKKNNRKSEFALRDAEWLSVLAMTQGSRYEQKKLNGAWKTVLLNQFHDILPGSSIDEVYEDADRDYAEVFEAVSEVQEKALARLARRVDTRGDGKPVLVFNSLPWDRSETVAADVKGLRKGTGYVAVASTGEESPVQVGADGKARFSAELPGMGHEVFHVRKGQCEEPRLTASRTRLENDCVRVTLDKLGRVSRITDKRNAREALAPGAVANRFILFEDKAAACGPAWDIDIFYNDKPLEFDGVLKSVKVVEKGPVRSVVRIKRTISRSTITQDIILTAGSARVDFATTVEWGDEKDVMLKVAFPVNARNERARYEIQYGNVERPTHGNMPQDFARFEVAAQKWADLSESDYGIALLNDCKYGHDTRDNVMRLTLLRAPKSPGKTADVNKTHRFTYSILPHEGDYTNGVVRAGYELNVPVIAESVKASKGAMPARQSFFSVSGENVVIDAVKKAEDDNGIIVRMYEAHGQRGRRTFSTSLPVKRIIETDLMEREERVLKHRKGKVSLTFKPFQIRTIKLVSAI